MDVLYLAYIHYFYPFLVIRGVEATSSLVKILADEGIAIVGKTADGVIARVPDDLPESPLWGHAHYLKADYLYQKAEDLKNEEEG